MELVYLKRFELICGASCIKDNMSGVIYEDFNPVGAGTDIHKICELLNKINDRADRNAELLDIDCVAQYHYCQEVQRILRKYGIDSLEKLDLCLMEQRVW